MIKIDQSIFKAYDIRGIYPEQINPEIAYAIGQGYVEVVKPKQIVIGHDVRLHSEELKKSMIEGLLDAGVDVVDVGLISTEMIYFATGNYGYDGGIQVTASHQSSEWHGAKLVKKNAEPVFKENGIEVIKEYVLSGKNIKKDRGQLSSKDILDDFSKFVISFVDLSLTKKLKIVVDANFGFQGRILDHIIESNKLPLDIIKLNYEPDGTFPKGKPNPYLLERRTEFVDLVKKEKPDFGIAWDADADRIFFCTKGGIFLEPYYTNTLLIKYMLGKFPGSKIVYDPRNIWALIDATKENGGTPVESPVGHSFIKAIMRKEDAIFCGESSGHTYYRDFWYADSGMIPFLQILEIISKEGKTLDQLIEPVLNKHFVSGEINFTIENTQKVLQSMKEKFSDAKMDEIDGLSFEYPDWRFNVRTSNTEPLLRLNMETRKKDILDQKLEEVESIINNC